MRFRRRRGFRRRGFRRRVRIRRRRAGRSYFAKRIGRRM